MRRFLRPLVGIDPATVSIQRGGRAQAAAAALGADALASAELIVLGTADALTAPRTLGVLAHELTHVARRRMPRFVPPIARPPAAQAGGNAAAPATVGPADEEALARDVEARVTAQAWVAGPAATPAAQPVGGVVAVQPAGGGVVARPPAGPGGAEPAPPVSNPDAAPTVSWGGLPAPWEPLPAWLAAPIPGQASTGRGETIAAAPVAPAPADVPAARAATQGGLPAGADRAPAVAARPAPASLSHATVASAPSPSVGRAAASSPAAAPAPTPATVPAAAQAAAAAPAPVVHRAEHDRSPASVLPPPEPPSPAASGPDLDALAQQVYAVLKRRLAVERRRLG